MLASLQLGYKAREPRRAVMIPSRMCAGGSWVDVCIHNISSRGALVATDIPPEPGTYIEIRRGAQSIIGRVVWRKERHFGVRAQDRINIDALVSEPRLASRPKRANDGDAAQELDRRASDRVKADAAIARQMERSRQLGGVFQFSLIVAGGFAVAGLVGMQVYETLSQPFATISAKL